MIRILSMARVDLERLARSRRILGALAVQVFVAYLASSYVRAIAVNNRIEASAFDVHAATLNNWVLLNYLLLTAFAYLVGDTILADTASGWAWLTVPRVGGRRMWWAAKTVSVVVTSLCFHAAYLVVCLAVGKGWRGMSLSTVASQLSTSRGIVAFRLFAVVPKGANILIKQLMLAGYEALAFSAIVLLIVALTPRARIASLPAGCALGVMMLDYLIGKLWDGWANVSLGRHLIELSHVAVPGFTTISWTTSVVVVVLMGILGVAIGGLTLTRTDL